MNVLKGGHDLVVHDINREAVALGDNGLIHGVRPGKVYFDLSTNSPTLIRHIHAEFAKVGGHVLDALVNGGPRGARSGRRGRGAAPARLGNDDCGRMHRRSQLRG